MHVGNNNRLSQDTLRNAVRIMITNLLMSMHSSVTTGGR
jgi:hypothetical protein